jgi:SDR family mycofactocin-dependent oxidoreductase
MSTPKVAFITGAARGLGRAHALRLAAAGMDIVAVDVCGDIPGIPYPLATDADMAETITGVEATGRRALAVRADVRDSAAIDQAAKDAVAEFGRIDVVVANAGVFAAAHVWETSDEMWRTVLDINLTGAWHTARATVPHLLERGSGSIVFVASIAGIKGIENLGAYAASKHGVVGLMRTLALELAPTHIRVNAVCPSNVGTHILHNESTYKLFRPDGERDDASLREAFATVNKLPVPWIDADDVAAAVAWLASDEARFVTGIVLPVDAGALLH